MSFIPTCVVSFQEVDDDQSVVLSLTQIIKQTFILPFLADQQLLSGQSQITENISNRQIDYKIHHGFTLDEEILIRNAFQIIADRLFKPEILQNMYQICGTSGVLLDKGVWSHSQLENDHNYHGAYDLIRFQLMCLKNVKFPPIHIHPMYKKSDTQSAGTVGCVSCIARRSKFSINGKFDVKLNRYNLDPLNKNLGNSVYWAGAIVHEMLHNLGHKHTNNDYSDRWQINVFEKCFIYNGNYLPL